MPPLLRTLTAQIIFAIVLGTIVGLIWGPSTRWLGILGTLLIQTIKTIAVPLIFFAILDSVLTSEIRWHKARRLIVVIAINTACAATIGLLFSNLFRPGEHLKLEQFQATAEAKLKFKDFAGKGIYDALNHVIPNNFVDPFQSNAVIAVVLIALLLGVAAKSVKEKDLGAAKSILVFQNSAEAMLKIFEQILKWIIKVIPLAVFGVIAKTIGEYGLSPLKGLAYYVLIGLLGLFVHVFLTYQLWIKYYLKRQLRDFWRIVKEPVTNAVGSNSSLATLPLTLKALEELKVSKASARLGACVATNLNNDGILLYEAMAVLLVAQAAGIELSLLQQIQVAGLSVLAAIGITGVPEAGLVSLSLVLTTVGLPLEILPILLTVDWIIARARSVVNVLSDIVVSMVIDSDGSIQVKAT